MTHNQKEQVWNDLSAAILSLPFVQEAVKGIILHVLAKAAGYGLVLNPSDVHSSVERKVDAYIRHRPSRAISCASPARLTGRIYEGCCHDCYYEAIGDHFGVSAEVVRLTFDMRDIVRDYVELQSVEPLELFVCTRLRLGSPADGAQMYAALLEFDNKLKRREIHMDDAAPSRGDDGALPYERVVTAQDGTLPQAPKLLEAQVLRLLRQRGYEDTVFHLEQWMELNGDWCVDGRPPSLEHILKRMPLSFSEARRLAILIVDIYRVAGLEPPGH